MTIAGAAALVYSSDSFREFLTSKGDTTSADWRLVAELSRQTGTTDLKALLDLGLVSEDLIADRLAEWSGLARWDPDDEDAAPHDGTPLEFMRSSSILVLEDGPGELRIVVADPSDQFAWSSVAGRHAGAEVRIGTQKEIGNYLHERAEAGEGAASDDAGESLDISGELSQLRDMASEAPVVRFFNTAVERAMDLGASDIHLERYDRRTSLRFRIDGILHDQPAPPAQMYEPVLCRIKILAGLDIAERRRAQDGRVPMRLRGRSVDMRISIVPTMYGQDAAIRIQDRQKLAEISLDELGFDKRHVDQLLGIARKSHGIMLITGPTGSGKTTTLYSILRSLVSNERKIVTVEDPVEYAMDGVNQIQVNNAINLSFSNTLRHILRHDPDVVLIGEIRDKETAEIAFQASLTGHMVLSTLHTNDVPGTFVRLVDMGVEPYLVNAAVEGVSAQRLVRRFCPACSNDAASRESCKTCGGLGYRGRVAIMECSGLTAEVKRYMLQGAEEHRIRESLLRSGFLPLRADAQRLIDAGVTDEAEVVRVLGAAADIEFDSSDAQ